jgi:hypothetical protein
LFNFETGKAKKSIKTNVVSNLNRNFGKVLQVNGKQTDSATKEAAAQSC